MQQPSKKLVALKSGKVVESGDTAAIFANPQQDYAKKLLASTLT